MATNPNVLENIASEYRKKNLGKSNGAIVNYQGYYNNVDHIYDEESDDARAHADDLHPMGKGTGMGHGYQLPKDDKSDTWSFDYSQFVTRENTENGLYIGGAYDRRGYEAGGIGTGSQNGRDFLMRISKYGPGKEYNQDDSVVDSIDEIEEIKWDGKGSY